MWKHAAAATVCARWRLACCALRCRRASRSTSGSTSYRSLSRSATTAARTCPTWPWRWTCCGPLQSSSRSQTGVRSGRQRARAHATYMYGQCDSACRRHPSIAKQRVTCFLAGVGPRSSVLRAAWARGLPMCQSALAQSAAHSTRLQLNRCRWHWSLHCTCVTRQRDYGSG